jgi:hypothetical protein
VPGSNEQERQCSSGILQDNRVVQKEPFVFTAGVSKIPAIFLHKDDKDIGDGIKYTVRLLVNNNYVEAQDLVVKVAKDDKGGYKIALSQDGNELPDSGIVEIWYKRVTSRRYKLKYSAELL